jgi:hypothetical protein
MQPQHAEYPERLILSTATLCHVCGTESPATRVEEGFTVVRVACCMCGAERLEPMHPAMHCADWALD